MANLSAGEAKARNIEKMGAELGAQYSALWQEVVWLHVKWGEYVELYGTKPSRIDILNKAAPSFFRLIQNSLWEDILLHLARLTDPLSSAGKKNLTILNLVALSMSLDSEAALKPLIEETVERTRFCRDWRNRHIAHKDLNLVVDTAAVPLESASRQQVRDALAAIVAVLNKIELLHLDSTTFFDRAGRGGGALSLLYVLDDGLKRGVERKEKMKQGDWLSADFRKQDL